MGKKSAFFQCLPDDPDATIFQTMTEQMASYWHKTTAKGPSGTGDWLIPHSLRLRETKRKIKTSENMNR